MLTDIHLTRPRRAVLNETIGRLPRGARVSYANPGDEAPAWRQGRPWPVLSRAERRLAVMRTLDPKSYGAAFHRLSLFEEAAADSRVARYDFYALSLDRTNDDAVWRRAPRPPLHDPSRRDAAWAHDGVVVAPDKLARRLFDRARSAAWWCYAGDCDLDALTLRLGNATDVATEVATDMCCDGAPAAGFLDGDDDDDAWLPRSARRKGRPLRRS